jgi:hypothetical protein
MKGWRVNVGVTGVVVLLTLAGGASGSGSSSPPQPADRTRTSTPAPSATSMTDQQTGALYVRLVAPLNSAATALNTVLASDPLDLPTARRSAAVLTTAIDRLTRELAAARWPADVQPLMDTLVQLLTTDAENTRAMAAATTTADLVIASAQLRTSSTRSVIQARLIRQRLGLPVTQPKN